MSLPVTETTFEVKNAASGEPVALAMQQLHLTGEVLPAGGRLRVSHRFASSAQKPLEVIYSFMLPRDATMRRFRVEGDGFSVESQLLPVDEATRTYEAGIEQGSLSTLATQHRDGVVNLAVGNIRPGETVTVWLEILCGVEVHDDGFRFRFPFTLAPSYHPRGRGTRQDDTVEIELPQNEFGDVLLPPLRKDATGLHEVSFDLQVRGFGELAEAGSPSHPVRIGSKDGAARIQLASGDVPNRDLVLDAKFVPKPQAMAEGDSFFAFLPSTFFGDKPAGPRRLVLLVDRSGSMQGQPMDQALRAVLACLAALEASDHFSIVAFDDKIERLSDKLLPATQENRDKAREFVRGIFARGGTELASGVEAAGAVLQGAGEIFILTDGQVFGADDILERAKKTGLRLHALGIGSASQDRFLAALAAETGGVSRFMTPQERVDLAAVDLFASAGAPVASDVTYDLPDGVIAPEPRKHVYSGTPVDVFGTVSHAGELSIRGSFGEKRIAIPEPAGASDTLRLLRGSRLIAELDMRAGTEEQRRTQNRIAARLRKLSEDYGLASREMALVAVVKRASDKPGGLPETKVVPLGLPQGMENFGAPGLAPTAPPPMMYAGGMMPASAPTPPQPLLAEMRRTRFSLGDDITGFFSRKKATPAKPVSAAPSMPSAAPPPPPPGDPLMDLAAQLAPDGGMPAGDRIAATVAALMAFVAEGHSTSSGAFRLHVRRMVAYLKGAAVPPNRKSLVDRAIAAAELGHPVPGDWLQAARQPDWASLERLLPVK